MSYQTQWTWIEVVVALLIVILVIFWELKFQPARRRLLRMSLWMVGVVALIFLYLKPVVQVAAPKKNGSIFTSPTRQGEKNNLLLNTSLVELKDPSDLVDVPYSIDKIQVYGDGLQPWQLKVLQGYEVVWRAPELPEGITSIQVPEVTEGISFEISGDVLMKENILLSLIGPEGPNLSLTLSPEKSQFQFTSTVKAAGLFEYQLLGIRDLDTVFSEVVPVQVNPSRRANLLLLGAFPSFEWNYLKNHLADLGFGVASRFQLSKDVYHSEYLNMPTTNLNVINSKLLEQFKLLVMDGKTFEALNKRQKQEIFSALELAKVGLFLMIDDLSELQAVRPFNTIQGSGDVKVSTAEKQIELLKMPFEINDPDWERIIFQDQEIGALTRRGIGKIGFSMIANSHVLELQGAPEIYGQLWDQLLSPVIGFDIDESHYYMPQFHFTDRQTDISFSFFGQPDVTIDGLKVPPTNSPIRPDLWTISYWPKRQGWHTIEVGGQEQTHFFVNAPKEWNTLQRYEKQRYNRFFFEANQIKAGSERKVKKPFSLWIPFVIFLLAISGLWLERKLS